MNHRRQFVPVPNKGKRTVIITAVIVFIIFFSFSIFRTMIREAGSGVGMAVVHTSDTTGGWFSNIATIFKIKSNLVNENEDLKNRLAEMEARFLDYDAVIAENKEFKQLMGRVSNQSFILAKILEKPSNSIYDTLVVDGGAGIGLISGQVAYANGEIPIGTVEEVNPHSALIRLFSSPKQSTEARLSILEGEKISYIDVTLVGRGGGNFQTTVPHDFEITTGALASSKGFDGGVIAKYQKTTSDVREPLQTLLLTAPVNVQELNFVQIAQN